MLWLCDRTLLSIVLCCVTVKSGGAVFCYDNRHSCTVLCQLCYGCAFTVLCYAMVVPYQVEITQWLCCVMAVLYCVMIWFAAVMCCVLLWLCCTVLCYAMVVLW